MLSERDLAYIEQSVPVLRDKGLAITTAFYRNLFQSHPALTNLFNMGNQAQGLQQQSLAAAVFAYAANINQSHLLGPVISRITHKHASLGIKPEHYPIVGEHLLAAIKEVLGAAATQPLLDAWGAAYHLLAGALIAEEKRLYSDADATPGTLDPYTVANVTQESSEVKSFILYPANGIKKPDFQPGQYVSVATKLDNGGQQLRQYSLSDAPSKPYLRISVKRESPSIDKPAGQVSNWLHDHVKVNDTLSLSKPFGDFKPNIHTPTPLVMISAGIGITPMIATLNELAHTRAHHHVIFAHAAKSKHHHSHQDDLQRATRTMPNLRSITFYDAVSSAPSAIPLAAGPMLAKNLPAWPYQNSAVYLCGPSQFMQQMRQQLLELGVPAHQVHREVFGPDLLEHLMG